MESVNLDQLKNSLIDDEYIVLCHGTMLSMEEIQQKIMKEGLYATGYSEGSSLFKTTNPIDVNISTDELKSKLDNWPHDSKNMVFLKLPLKYFNIYADNSDLDCQKTRAFTKKVELEDGRYKYVVDPKFIVGAYNLESENVLLNQNYEKELSPATELVLESKLRDLQTEMGVIDLADEQQKETVEQKEPEKNYKYYYEELMKAVKKRQTMINATEEDKKQITGEIFYNEGYLIEKINSEDEMREIMTSVVNDLSGNEPDVKLQNIILEEMQERLKKINNKNQESIVDVKSPERPTENKNTSIDFSVMINQLRAQNIQISSEYKSMLSDGYIDDNELAILMSRLKDLSDNASVIKSMVTDKSQEAMIDSIIEMINQESIKMTTMQRGIEEINHSFGR